MGYFPGIVLKQSFFYVKNAEGSTGQVTLFFGIIDTQSERGICESAQKYSQQLFHIHSKN